MNTLPKISIITVVYNGAQFISPTIESVLTQTFESIEYIIIDGASSDDTMGIVKSHNIDVVICEPDNGVYDAMNKGLALAKGEYVLFLNAGDELASPNILADLFQTSQDSDVIYGETIIIDQNRKEIGTRTELTSRKLPAKLTKKDFLNGQVVSHQSFIPKRSICESYDLKYSCSADINWMLQIMDKAQETHHTQKPISKYLQGGISDRNLKTCWKERLLIMIKHFGSMATTLAHLKFILRFIDYGKYKLKK